jgi:hypothetical protein
MKELYAESKANGACMYQLMFEVHLIWPFGNYKEYGTNSHKY